MGLYTRLLALDSSKIPVHQFAAALGEVKRGNVSGTTVGDVFGLSTPERAEAATLIARFSDVLNPLTSVEFHEVLMLAEGGYAYATEAALVNRLGV